MSFGRCHSPMTLLCGFLLPLAFVVGGVLFRPATTLALGPTIFEVHGAFPDSMYDLGWGRGIVTGIDVIAEKYIPPENQRICSVGHRVRRMNQQTDSVVLTVYQNGAEPGGAGSAVLASVLVPAAFLPTNQSDYAEFALDPCLDLAAGTTYWFQFSRSQYDPFQSMYLSVVRSADEYSYSSYWEYHTYAFYPVGWTEYTNKELAIRLTGEPSQPPSIGDLKQYHSDALTEIAEGDTTMEDEVIFGATLQSSSTNQVRLEVEYTTSTSFSGVANATSGPVLPGSQATTSVSDLPDGQYRWRARAVDTVTNLASDWQEYGALGSGDFTVHTVPLYTQVISDYPSAILTSQWASLLYGSGSYKDCYENGTTNSTIRRCGCAITSMVMVGRYYGLNIGIDNSDNSPLGINNWLTSNDGYNASGSLWWSKAVEYLGNVSAGKKKNHLTLDYHNASSATRGALIDQYLGDNKPAIGHSATYGHYFVLKNKYQKAPDQFTYLINDPLWFNTKRLDETKNLANNIQAYNNEFDKANLFSYHASPVDILGSMTVYIASPAELLITDPSGRRIGRDPVSGTDYAEIPRANYSLEGPIISSDEPLPPGSVHEKKIVYIPQTEPGKYDIKVIGTGEGSYTIGGLVYDDNGDGHTAEVTGTIETGKIVDYIADPQNSSTVIAPVDTIPPMSTVNISGTAGLNGWYVSDVTATLSAEDNEGGSGVSSIEYSLDNESTWQKYSQPIVISTEGAQSIFYRAKDVAGNVEDAKSSTIKIDKTPPEAEIGWDVDKRSIVVRGLDNLTQEPKVSTTSLPAKSIFGDAFDDLQQKMSDDDGATLLPAALLGFRSLRPVRTVYAVSDEAGNTAALTVRTIGIGQTIRATIEQIIYNNGMPATPPANALTYIWFADKAGSVRDFY
ncbi:MAG TPA: hypothetical protein VMC43_01120, partial [Candidatus Paceibacterota bacterium]|nr:hypothetical protein [Candidatus Paceibacterota bacterium]